MRYEETQYKYWKPNTPEEIKDFYALDVVKHITSPEIKKLKLLDGKLSGRVSSAIKESDVADIIVGSKSELKKYGIEVIITPGNHTIDDFTLIFKDREIITNIKLSTFEGSDNSCGKISIQYMLTDEKSTSSKNLAQKLLNSDYFYGNNYYFFVVSKKTNEIILNSLQTLNHMTPNGSNPPFQINWSKNKVANLDLLKDWSGCFNVLDAWEESCDKQIAVLMATKNACRYVKDSFRGERR
jgi:hypothetical protein